MKKANSAPYWLSHVADFFDFSKSQFVFFVEKVNTRPDWVETAVEEGLP